MEKLQTYTNLQEAILMSIDNAIGDCNIIVWGQFWTAMEAQSHIGWIGML
jgi:hypothetical protein